MCGVGQVIGSTMRCCLLSVNSQYGKVTWELEGAAIVLSSQYPLNSQFGFEFAVSMDHFDNFPLQPEAR